MANGLRLVFRDSTLNRHQTSRRIAARIKRRRARILAQDATARWFRTVPYQNALVHAQCHYMDVIGTKASTPEEKASKALRIAEMTVSMAKIAVDGKRVFNTPTEIVERL